MRANRSKADASIGTPAARTLEQAAVPFQLHAYDFRGSGAGIALEASELMGVAPARVLKTLMAVVDDRTLVVTLVPADRDLNLKALASAMGGKRADMADVRQAERASGYVKGGISPFGQRRQAPAVVDRSVLDHVSVFVNGGRRGLEIELAPRDLIAALDATVAAITR
ncbi:MAG TPA: Cys-tRNA(Pro) deacylase [Geminicoccaceae bacterium]|nr:Cys-tRNA(Pro) deacylase [Geminicoccaceae bacterium]